MLVTLTHAQESRFPILRPGDLVFWEADQGGEYVPARLLGFGEYQSISGTAEGLTIQLTNRKDRVTRTHGPVSGGEVFVVQPGRVAPRSLVKRHKAGYQFADGAWGVDTTCPVHGVIHSSPQPRLCKLSDADQAVADEVTEAARQERVISHGAAREIAAWVRPDHPFTLTGALASREDGSGVPEPEAPAGPVSAGLARLGSFVWVELHVERAPWRRAALEALGRYLDAAVPRGPYERWSSFPVDAPNGDGRYTVSGEGTGDLDRGWVARFEGKWLGSFGTEAAARKCLFFSYYKRMYPEAYPPLHYAVRARRPRLTTLP